MFESILDYITSSITVGSDLYDYLSNMDYDLPEDGWKLNIKLHHSNQKISQKQPFKRLIRKMNMR